MMTLKPRLLKCHDIFGRLDKALMDSVVRAEGEQQNNKGNIQALPSVIGLDGEVESFLYEVKNYLRDLLNLFRIVFGFAKIDAATLYDAKDQGDSAVVKWASAMFGDQDDLTLLLRTEQPWVGQCIRKRNAVEHPGGWCGTLTVHNVRAVGDGFVPPTWNLDGEPESNIFTDMEVTMHNMLTIAEDWLVHCIKKRLLFETIAFYEIAEKDRSPEMPTRLRVDLSPEMLAKFPRKAS